MRYEFKLALSALTAVLTIVVILQMCREALGRPKPSASSRGHKPRQRH